MTAAKPAISRPFGVVWGQVYGMQHPIVSHRAERFLPQARALGAGLVRLFLYWNQLEPARGAYTWHALDAFVAQLEPGDEAWVTLNTVSRWATRHPTDLLPNAPALDHHTYYQFVHAAVTRAAGRVRYWQMDFELVAPLFWGGTPDEYLAQLRVFYRAVKDADPNALVVPAGFLDGEYEAADARPVEQQARVDALHKILAEGHPYFDAVDLHLYNDPYRIPDVLGYVRRTMAALGYDRPILVGEYNGPGFPSFPENRAAFGALAGAMRSFGAAQLATDPDVRARETAAEDDAMRRLYARRDTWPAQTQMFMEGCPPALEAKRNRIQAREIVMRNLFALAAGASKTCCYELAPSVAGKPFRVLNLMFGKYALMAYGPAGLTALRPAARAFQRMTHLLSGVSAVDALRAPESPDLVAFRVDRGPSHPVIVAWERRDPFSGEDAPGVIYPLPGRYDQVTRSLDVHGRAVEAHLDRGTIVVPLTDDPVFLEVRPRRGAATAGDHDG